MNTHRGDHDRIRAQLDDLVDGALTADERRDLEAHLETCGACRAELAARRELLAETAALPRSVEPARDLWPEIRGRMGEQEARTGRPGRFERRGRFGYRTLAAAATVLLLAGAAALALWLAGGTGDAPRTVAREAATPPDSGRTGLVADWRSVEGDYAGAADELQETLDEIGDRLSPETREIVERNLRMIDEAIAESRAALERDPANRDLQRALRSAWSSKVEMLQYVTRL